MRKRILKTPRMPNYRHQMINEAASAHDSLDFYHDKLIPHLDSIINVDRIIRNANKWTKDKKQIHSFVMTSGVNWHTDEIGVIDLKTTFIYIVKQTGRYRLESDYKSIETKQGRWYEFNQTKEHRYLPINDAVHSLSLILCVDFFNYTATK